ncbi:hypothetical protein [Methyloceanibacter marginalis]|nr:hypothetical protein [Methyloceanibacter marginalis]
MLETDGQGLAWPGSLPLLHAVADGVIAATFLLVPAVLLYLYRRRGESSEREAALVKLFLLFVFAVGLVHFAALLAPWLKAPALEGLLKGAAALLALATAIGLLWLAPHLLGLPPATGFRRKSPRT